MDVIPSEAKSIAGDAWLFGMPLVYIGIQIDVSTHVAKPAGPFAPMNQFAHFREFPDASNKTIVGLNVDTLYSLAWLDIGKEPIVLSIPPMGERFWVMQLIDAWNNVPAAPGSRAFDGKGGTFVIVGPDLERNTSRRPHGAAHADESGHARWAHVHRRQAGLCGGARPSGSVQTGAAVRLGN